MDLPVLPPLHRIGSLLIKPASALCNLDCAYCFYLEKEALYPGETRAPESRAPEEPAQASSTLDTDITVPRRTLASELYPRAVRVVPASPATDTIRQATDTDRIGLTVPAAARSLERDDIARFYRDLNRPL